MSLSTSGLLSRGACSSLQPTWLEWAYLVSQAVFVCACPVMLCMHCTPLPALKHLEVEQWSEQM